MDHEAKHEGERQFESEQTRDREAYLGRVMHRKRGEGEAVRRPRLLLIEDPDERGAIRVVDNGPADERTPQE